VRRELNPQKSLNGLTAMGYVLTGARKRKQNIESRQESKALPGLKTGNGIDVGGRFPRLSLGKLISQMLFMLDSERGTCLSLRRKKRTWVGNSTGQH